MAKHRKISQNSLHAKTVIGGALAAGGMLLAVPAGSAFAYTNTTTTATTMAKAPVKANPFQKLIRLERQFDREILSILRGPVKRAPAPAQSR
jgi:hypothetical protein